MGKKYVFCIFWLCGSMVLPMEKTEPPKPNQKQELHLFNQPQSLLMQAAKRVLLNWRDALDSKPLRRDWSKLPKDLQNLMRHCVNQPLYTAGRTILFYSETPYDVDFFITSLKADPEVRDHFGYTPLLYMIQNKPQNVPELVRLRANQAPLPPPNMELIHQYAVQGLNKLINMTLAQGVAVDAQVVYTQRTALMCAAQCCKGPTVELLIQKGASVNATNFEGNTPLVAAIHGGDQRIVDYLIAKKADINHKNIAGQTPLHLAALGNEKSLIKRLLENNARINAEDNDRKTPLMYAIEKCNIAIAEFLITKNPNLNKQDYLGSTALTKASRRGLLGLVQQLLQAGADPRIKNRANHTALNIASSVMCNYFQAANEAQTKSDKAYAHEKFDIYRRIIQLLEPRTTAENAAEATHTFQSD